MRRRRLPRAHLVALGSDRFRAGIVAFLAESIFGTAKLLRFLLVALKLLADSPQLLSSTS